ncbi:hypothetical protein TWF694_002523 [Orbilia ellipsospora]|uniref:Nucleoside phosphorylase domain-containing protein n=1 Tax=Orbilia ellipsospora TaxID=2528407 RepID=A0AAV9X3J1_9PEZI
MDLTHKSYSVGWICPLFIEQTAAAAMLDEIHPDLTKLPGDPNTYTLGAIAHHNVVIAGLPLGRYGTNSATATATWMVNTFPSVKSILLVGVGGGIPTKVRLGDVVVSTPTETNPGVIQWDLGKREGNDSFKRVGSLNGPPTSLLTALSKLRKNYELHGSKISGYLEELKVKYPRLAPKYLRSKKLRDVPFQWYYDHVTKPIQSNVEDAKMDIDDSKSREDDEDIEEDEEVEDDKDMESNVGEQSCRWCDETKVLDRKVKTRDMQIHFGLIASGNQVIKDGRFRRKLDRELGGKVLCIEMEAAGLMNDFPCLVIRGICDYADSHKNKSWQEHAAIVAAAFAKELLECLSPSEVDGERTVKDILKQMSKIESNLETVKCELDGQKDDEILKWLARDYGHEQSEFDRQRQPGTGLWLLESAEFQNWVNGGRTLFCPGAPGAGKTILASLVVDHLRASFQKNSQVSFVYIYCSYQIRGEQTIEDLLGSILRQLCRGRPSVPDALKELHDEYRKTSLRPSLARILKILESVITFYSTIFIVIDALDECDCWEALVRQIFGFQTKTSVRFFATSRFIPEITKTFQGKPTYEIRAREDDLRKYIQTDAQCITNIIGNNPDLLREIEDKILASVDGMFLLAKLRLNFLKGATSLKQIEKTLEESPKVSIRHGDIDSDHTIAYNDAYDKTMQAIKAQIYLSRRCAEKALAWIVFAKRPLHISELRHALAIETGVSELDLKNLSPQSLIINICKGLITIDEMGYVRLVHYTAQEYLHRNGAWFPEALDYIAETCIVYLSYDTFRTDLTITPKEIGVRLSSNPFYGYVARNWGHHVRVSSLEGGQLVVNFLGDPSKVSASSSVLRDPQTAAYARSSDSPSLKISGEHIAAYFGLAKSLAAMLAKGMDMGVKDKLGRTPLWWAGEGGFATIVEMLADNSSCLEAQDYRFRQTPLLWLAGSGKVDVVEVLMKKGANLEAKDTMGRTALFLAAENGQVAVVKLLLYKGAKLEAQDSKLQTPLLAAAEKRNLEVVGILADKGAKLDIQYQDGFNLLTWAARFGHAGLVELLADKGADLEAREKRWGRTALCLAVQNGYTAMAEMLLQKGAKIDAQDIRWGQTPLLWAVENWEIASIETLVAKGANLDIADRKGQTPLFLAVKEKQLKTVNLLMKCGATLRGKDDDIQSSLWWAVENELSALVRLLTKNGANPEKLSKSRRTTPLGWALEKNCWQIIEALGYPSRYDAKKGIFRTPLEWAVKNRLVGAIKALEGADLEAKDGFDDHTPLSWAVENKYPEIVEALAAKGAEIDPRDAGDITPLARIIERGCGIRKNMRGSWHPVYWVNGVPRPKGWDDIVHKDSEFRPLIEVLAKRGADLDFTDDQGRTLLTQASDCEWDMAVEVLLRASRKPKAWVREQYHSYLKAQNESCLCEGTGDSDFCLIWPLVTRGSRIPPI